jgi:fibro-slime domain-containing protein
MNRVERTSLLMGTLALVACGGSSSKGSCPAGQYDGGNGICVATGTCPAGYHDGGDGKCTVMGGCSTGYQLAANGACVMATACPTGTHDNGAGVCVPTISCPTGYHDGGSGTCVPTGSCSSGYHDGGNGDCLIVGTCSTGFHNGGNGTCVPLVACSAGYHDGGNGVCVRDGQCSSGYHDGGDGRCLTLDQCSAGYHDGGGGTCTTIIGCLSSYRDDGAGKCVCRPSTSNDFSLLCACAAGFHDNGAGKCISSGCAVGYHDGGDGTCWPAGSCALNYYLDGTGLCVNQPVVGTGGIGAGGVGGIGGVGGLMTGTDAGYPGGGASGSDGGIRIDGPLGSGGLQGTGGRPGTGGIGGYAGSGGTGGISYPSTCGNKKLEGSENCDDGNAVSGDGCSSTCHVEPGADCPNIGQPCIKFGCGNGKVETGEMCDCGNDSRNLPSGCATMNGLFYGDGKGCSKTCTKEPSCRDGAGKTRACDPVCGDGNLEPGEACDDGNLFDGDGCSSQCQKEDGFTCTTATFQDSTTCQSGSGQCLHLPVVYRDFQPENVSPGGHPDFYFLGTKAGGSSSPTTICVPNASGPARGNDSTARCWDIAAPELLNGRPQFNASRASNTCACQFSDWSIGNLDRISGGYVKSDSPLSDGFITTPGEFSVTGPSGTSAGQITGYTPTSPGGPVWKGTVPIVKDKQSFDQWFNNDNTVNKTFMDVLEMTSIGTNVYQYSSQVHLQTGGFFPLDLLNPSQATLCNLWPYWNRTSGIPIWASCRGDQYLFPPYVTASDCGSSSSLSSGCWMSSLNGNKHDYYFTVEAHYYFVYDRNGLALQFYGDDDLFVFINGMLVLDLGGIHQQLPGKVTVGSDGNATIIEGGCLDTAGNLPIPTLAAYAAGGCRPTGSSTSLNPVSPDDFRTRTVNLDLVDGRTYEIAIFGANRHPTKSDFQITLNGSTTKKSICTRN